MNAQREATTVADVKAQIQSLADEIAVLRAVADGDPRRATADRVVAVKVDMIRRLRALLPGIPTPTDVRRQPGLGAEAAAVPTFAVARRVGSA